MFLRTDSKFATRILFLLVVVSRCFTSSDKKGIKRRLMFKSMESCLALKLAPTLEKALFKSTLDPIYAHVFQYEMHWKKPAHGAFESRK